MSGSHFPQEPGIRRRSKKLAKGTFACPKCIIIRVPCKECSTANQVVTVHNNAQLHSHCDQCNNPCPNPKARLKEHREMQHKERRFSCSLCGFFSTSRASLIKHRKREHTDYGSRNRKEKQEPNLLVGHDQLFYCDLCDYTAKVADNLKRHKERIHERVKYSCDKCEFSASKPSDLKVHNEIKHLGIRYPCDLCDYAAVTRTVLRRHQKTVHDKMRYKCEECDYSSTDKRCLKNHMERSHDYIVQE